MAWETRKGAKGKYYTRSRRIDGQIQREYLGCGETARLSAESDRVAREAQTFLYKQRLQQQEQRATIYAAILAPLDGLDILCQVAIQRELEAAGYHQHDRGEWRKRRRPHGTKGISDDNSGSYQRRDDQSNLDN